MTLSRQSQLRHMRQFYKQRQKDIRSRLNDFQKFRHQPKTKLFYELCFCLCTPQSRAVNCEKAVDLLVRKRLLKNGTVSDIARTLKGLVRFHNNKARYLNEARHKILFNREFDFQDIFDPANIDKTREWLYKNINGLGIKEASHFLRNIGYGQNLAILDVHVFKHMLRLRMIPQRPKTLSGKQYLQLEKRLRRFSQKIGIPMDELDILFWSMETGIILK